MQRIQADSPDQTPDLLISKRRRGEILQCPKFQGYIPMPSRDISSFRFHSQGRGSGKFGCQISTLVSENGGAGAEVGSNLGNPAMGNWQSGRVDLLEPAPEVLGNRKLLFKRWWDFALQFNNLQPALFGKGILHIRHILSENFRIIQGVCSMLSNFQQNSSTIQHLVKFFVHIIILEFVRREH